MKLVEIVNHLLAVSIVSNNMIDYPLLLIHEASFLRRCHLEPLMLLHVQLLFFGRQEQLRMFLLLLLLHLYLRPEGLEKLLKVFLRHSPHIGVKI